MNAKPIVPKIAKEFGGGGVYTVVSGNSNKMTVNDENKIFRIDDV